MFKVIGSFIAVAGLALSTGQTAEAHGFGYHGHGSPVHRYDVFYRTKHMPGWVRKKRHFRHWYAHSPIRFDYRLSWTDVYDVYRWERRYGSPRFYSSRYRHYRNDRRKHRAFKRRKYRGNH